MAGGGYPVAPATPVAVPTLSAAGDFCCKGRSNERVEPMQGVTVQIAPGTDDDYPATIAVDPDIEWTDELCAETIAGVLRSIVDAAEDVNPVAFQMAVVRALSGGS